MPLPRIRTANDVERDSEDNSAEEIRALRSEIKRLLEAQLESERVTQSLIDELRKQGKKDSSTTNETLERGQRRSKRTGKM